MLWFQEVAPIRQKMMIAFTGMTLLVALGVMTTFVASVAGYPIVGLALGAAITIAAGCAGARIRTAVCDPYVSTVVRMEALAKGDLDAPIAHTAYRDCVGRMTKAMFSFRETAAARLKQSAAQDEMIAVFRDHLEKFGRGDLTASITADLMPEYLPLKTDFNAAIDSMRNLIGSVSDSAASIQTGSGEIAQASEDLARRTESNAASLEETTASVTQMDARLRASAAAATRTVQRANQTIATVGSGRTVAEEAVQAMGRVSESAKGIDSVIEGLDKIAFQTRVLAMNAAVEAGRAGDAGRGFAVVADLVSALAMRAEEEAKRARDQLTVTQTEVVTAVEAVTRVDGALSTIVDDVAEVHELLATMAADNQAQSAAITEISTAIGTMDQSTQQNAAMVEETSAAARNLANEVRSLSTQAASFKISRGDGPRSTARKPDYAPQAAYA
ncbi:MULTISPECIES: methyl-accepting chemotaxis protein [unclassified Sphingomonas]|uniref:methyl-accepting chemotaxis protein n=1 Tax=unclassified Sphingomonas TaxID=196159 RepID=UPI0006F471FF|nr:MULTISPECIES: methyl-accepting chemotaxis protein [unclassified Sphingomonas]KQS49616.1 chemotaxis protein [Sphingomonas sp. Leaf198]